MEHAQKQFDKIEMRVEKLDDKVDKLKEDIIELRGEVRVYAYEVNKHVAGDNKIITEILPVIHDIKRLLPELHLLAQKEQARQLVEKESEAYKKKVKTNLSIIGGLLAACATIFGMLFKK